MRGGNPRGTAHRAEACGLSPSGKAPPRHDAESRLWLQLAAEETETLAARAREIAEPCEIRHRSETAATIRKSVQEASEGGAAMAHRWTRIPEQWRPDIVQREFDGASTTTADPGAAVEEERKQWAGYWSPPGVERVRFAWGRVANLARPSLAAFSAAARKFPRTTDIGVEGMLLVDFDALDDDGIEACMDVMMAWETIGYIPRLIALVPVNMIPKKDGGRRPIGVRPSPYRIWAKARASEVRSWEHQWKRKYFLASPGKSAEGAAWNAALRAEIAAAANAESGSVLWDKGKVLRARATRLAR